MPSPVVPVSLFVALALSAPLRAEDAPITLAPPCATTDDQNDCVRILACIGSEGNWFNGRAFGRGSGTLAGRTAFGAQCVGRWRSRNAMGLGQADVQCDDGMEVTVLYYLQDDYTGTAIGNGRTNRGEFVRAWSGLNVLEYLRDRSAPEGENQVFLPCGSQPIPMS